MNPRIQKYLRGAQRNANETYANFGGGVPQKYWNADANQAGAHPDVSASQPYILTISNSTASAVSNFDVLGASTYLSNPISGSWSAGSLTVSGVTISSLIANVTYQDLLSQSVINPFTIGQTYIVAVVNNQQAFVPYTINTKDANGNQALRVITPFIDLYQFQAGASLDNTPYKIDALTKLTFTTIYASAVFNLYFFPASNVNPARQLSDAPPVKGYGSPGVIRSNVAIVSNNQAAPTANFTGIRSRLG